MPPLDQITLLVMALLEPAMAAGLPQSEAKRIYGQLMPHFASASAQHHDFHILLLDSVARAIATAQSSPDKN
jgi:hypothetical protein